MNNYADRGGCYPPKPKAEADNTLLDLHNCSYHTQPHPIIALLFIQNISRALKIQAYNFFLNRVLSGSRKNRSLLKNYE